MKKIAVIILLAGAAYWFYSANFIEDIRMEILLKKMESAFDRKDWDSMRQNVSAKYYDVYGSDGDDRMIWLQTTFSEETGSKVDFDSHEKHFDSDRVHCDVDYKVIFSKQNYPGNYSNFIEKMKIKFLKEDDGKWRVVNAEMNQ